MGLALYLMDRLAPGLHPSLGSDDGPSLPQPHSGQNPVPTVRSLLPTLKAHLFTQQTFECSYEGQELS